MKKHFHILSLCALTACGILYIQTAFAEPTTKATTDTKNATATPPKKISKTTNKDVELTPGFEPEPGFDGVKKVTPKKPVHKPKLRAIQPQVTTIDKIVQTKNTLDIRDPATRQKLKRAINVTIKDDIVAQSGAVKGLFRKTGVEDVTQYLVIRHGQRKGAQVFQGSTRLASDYNIVLPSPKDLLALGVKQNILPVDLIKDNTTQVLVWRTETNASGVTLYKLSLLKVFGNYVGRSFDHTVAYKDPKTKKIVRTASVDVLKHHPHNMIRVTPLNKNGELLVNNAQIFEWNHWQGVFIVPKTVPTAPKRRTSQLALPPKTSAPL